MNAWIVLVNQIVVMNVADHTQLDIRKSARLVEEWDIFQISGISNCIVFVGNIKVVLSEHTTDYLGNSLLLFNRKLINCI